MFNVQYSVRGFYVHIENVEPLLLQSVQTCFVYAGGDLQVVPVLNHIRADCSGAESNLGCASPYLNFVDTYLPPGCDTSKLAINSWPAHQLATSSCRIRIV